MGSQCYNTRSVGPHDSPGRAVVSERKSMPRPTKTYRRQKLSAAAAWKRGEKPEAYKLWDKAAASYREHLAKKHNKKKAAEDAKAAEAAETSGEKAGAAG